MRTKSFQGVAAPNPEQTERMAARDAQHTRPPPGSHAGSVLAFHAWPPCPGLLGCSARCSSRLACFRSSKRAAVPIRGDYLYNADGTISEGASSTTTAGPWPHDHGWHAHQHGWGERHGRHRHGCHRTDRRRRCPHRWHGAGASRWQRQHRGVAAASRAPPRVASPRRGRRAVTPLSCGTQTCDANAQVCCAGLGGIGCIGINQDCGGAVLGCTVNEDCGGNDICCISITGDVNAASSCKPTCDTMGNGRDRQLCQTADECRPPFRFCTPTIFGGEHLHAPTVAVLSAIWRAARRAPWARPARFFDLRSGRRR